jgi:hypothetical protein
LSTEWNIQISLAMVEPPLIVRRDCMKRNIKKNNVLQLRKKHMFKLIIKYHYCSLHDIIITIIIVEL